MSQHWQVTSIGHVHSPYVQPQGTPIQSGSDDTPATIKIDEAYVEALADLDGFERIWVLTWQHRAKPFAAKVTPYMDTNPRGLFSTRAPSRPNPIGLSVVRLAGVQDNVLKIRGCDMLDGTPVLDIKPYAPQFDAVGDSRAGWLTTKDPKQFRADERFGREE